ncbi:DUF4388 domain-containing protein [Geomonas nitrogeniifigens]|uniref:DUF4388 domain-containing protein n=1 Tax=Geomonas diazotrophica TaxID=2843197 RepID=A0ABX8JMY5_9BACT|nr:DUF4388 domain-containing protein [Geomonas nitrogeniifigens]QWV97959.1 DUF4388 domain-containing protein [Geomonas nitrogeniifigens]
MSLVGNIEDLGLGEIMQIVSMSRKSGVLSLKSRGREARIVFHNGQVTRASSTMFQQNMGELLIRRGVIDRGTLNRALSAQADEGYRQLLGTIMVERFEVSAEAIDAVVREQIERVVYSLFTWTSGTFVFEMQEVTEGVAIRIDPVQFMPIQGLNPQFLAMEGSRILDEKRHRGELVEEPEAPVVSARSANPGREPAKIPATPEPPALALGERGAASETVEITAWLVMAVGGAALLYGIAGLMKYYGRDWQTVLSEPYLVPVTKFSVFIDLGFIPWTITLASIYLLWAAYQFWKLREGSLNRLIEGAWSGIAVVVVYEVFEFRQWVKLASSNAAFSYYAIGVVGLIFGTALLSTPFAGLLLCLKSDWMSRELRKPCLVPSGARPL